MGGLLGLALADYALVSPPSGGQTMQIVELALYLAPLAIGLLGCSSGASAARAARADAPAAAPDWIAVPRRDPQQEIDERGGATGSDPGGHLDGMALDSPSFIPAVAAGDDLGSRT